MEKPAENAKDDKGNKTCYNCGKTFRTPAELVRHKGRKTPCLIRDISHENRLNPNRCIYCNYVFKQAQGLERHKSVCKIKNGGINILDDKIRHEQEIRVLKDERERDRIEYERKMVEMRAEMRAELQAEMVEMKKQICDRKVEVNMVNNVTNNTLNVNNINVTVGDWSNPAIDKIKLSVEELIKHHHLPQLFFMSIYMNPNVTENHSIIPRNVKDKRVLFHQDGTWSMYQGDELMEMLKRVANISCSKGVDLISGRNGLVPNGDEKIYRALPESLRTQIEKGILKERLTPDAIFGYLFANARLLTGTDNKLPKMINNP